MGDAQKFEHTCLNTHSDDFGSALGHGGGYRQVYYKTATMLFNLQYVLGDELFRKAMQNYFSTWRLAHPYFNDFRNSIIQYTKVDLNWFFDQWYFEAGHPMVEVSYSYDEATKKIKVLVEQIQNPQRQPAIFQMPVAIDIYTKDGKKERKEVMVNQRTQTFNFAVNEEPALINFDADRMILGIAQDNKTEENYIFQYQHAPKFMDRIEAVEYLKESVSK